MRKNKKNIEEIQLKALNLLNKSELTNYQIGKETGITEASIGNYRKNKTIPTEANANMLIHYFEKQANIHQEGEKSIVVGNISGGRVEHIGNRDTINYNGLSREDLIAMVEERFHHMLQKEEDIRVIFEENRKLTDEVVRQNEEQRKYNEAYRRQVIRIEELTDKLLNKL